MLATERAVLIRYEWKGQAYVGSGLRVCSQFVLTADHCTEGVRHRVLCDNREHDATVWVRSGSRDVDLGILYVPSAREVDSLEYARVDRTVAARIDGCQALGYPRWKSTDERILVQLDGYIPSAEGLRAVSQHRQQVDWLTLKATGPAIAEGGLIPSGNIEAKGSPWAGMSGAVVVTDGLVIGVVRSHNLAEGGGSLAVTPISAIEQLPVNLQDRMWHALGVREPRELPTLVSRRTTLSEMLPFEPLDQQSIVFGLGRTEDLRTDLSEYLSGNIGPGAIAAEVEAKLADGSVLLLGKGAVGKTTLATWIAVRHLSSSGQCYYLDLSKVEGNDIQLASRCISILHLLSTRTSLIVIDNVHRNEQIATTLLRNWKRVASPGKMLLVGRHTLSSDYPDPSHHLPFLVDHVATLELDTDDLLHTYSRIVDKYTAGAEIAPPAAALQSWLRLFGGDRVAFGFAVRHHLETQGSHKWFASGGVLHPRDALIHMQEEYFDRWPNAKAELIKLAAGASVELGIPEEAINVSLIREAVESGIVLRTTHGSQAYRRYSLVHPGLGWLLLSAARVKEGPVLQEIAKASPFIGFALAARLEAAENINGTVQVLAIVSKDADSLIAGLQPVTMSRNLDRLQRFGVISLADVDKILIESNRLETFFDRVLDYGLGSTLELIRAAERRLPRLHEKLLLFLSDQSSINRLADAADRDLGSTGGFLAAVVAVEQARALVEEVVAALEAPERVARLADAADQDIGQTGGFLAQIAGRWPGLAEKVVAALEAPERVARLADAADRDLGSTVGFLAAVVAVEQARALVEEVVAALEAPERVVRLADAADRDLGSTGRFLAEVAGRWPGLAEEVVAALEAPERVARLADAADQDIGQTAGFLAQIAGRWPGLAEEVVAALEAPERVARLADAADRALGQTGGFLAQIAERWPGLAEEVVAALEAPERVARLADAADQDIGQTGGFLAQIAGRWPGLAEEVVAALEAPERVARLADAADQDIGQTGGFLAQIGRRRPGLAEKVVAALEAPERVARLADAADQDISQIAGFLVQIGRRRPGLAEKVVAALEAPERVARLAEKFLASPPYHAVPFLVFCRKLMPTIFNGIMQSVISSSSQGRLADLITRDLRYSGWLLEYLYSDYPDVAKDVLHQIVDTRSINSLIKAAQPTERVARSAKALSIVAQFFNDMEDHERARQLLEILLAVFPQGYHLGGSMHLREVARVVSLVHRVALDLEEQAEKALEVVARSHYWLEREFLHAHCGSLADSLDALWWSKAPLPILRSICGHRLGDRIVDEFSLLRLVKPRTDYMRDPLRLAGLLGKYGLDIPSQDLSLDITDVSEELLPSLIAGSMNLNTKMQILAGLYIIRHDSRLEDVMNWDVAEVRDSWQSARTYRERPDQLRFKMEMIAWLDKSTD